MPLLMIMVLLPNPKQGHLSKLVSVDFSFAATLEFAFVHSTYVLRVVRKVWGMVERGHTDMFPHFSKAFLK